ncbi:MAG TPA: hypothetical protein VJH22_00090 [Candidatus Nanoarchaeia archaeon]|nr:hypothetical protein [Candidatus Nanoarchaeia archaeon]
MRNLLIAAIIVVMMFVSSCVVVENTCPQQNQTITEVELFSTDVLTLLDEGRLSSTKVTVDGVKLGDSFQDVVKRLGAPAIIDEYYDDAVLNAKYETADGKAAYIFHVENETVTRMVIREGVNDRLPSGSKIDMTLEEITARFGKPDRSEDVSLGTSGYRAYYYDSLGLEIYHQRKKMIGFALVAPRPVVASAQ